MENFFYRVSKNDTVLSVALKFCLPPLVIIKENSLTSEICEGDILYIKRISGTPYVVQPFDSAKSVAKKFGVSEEELLEKNGVPYLFYGLTVWI